MSEWFDSHCHLDAESLRISSGEDWVCASDAVLARARQVGVRSFLVVGVGGRPAAEQALALARRHEDVACGVGVHPHDAAHTPRADEDFLQQQLRLGAAVAVGEVGLDYHYDHSPRAAQRECFARWIAFAREARLPLIVHTREAARDTLDLLRSEGAQDVGGVIHCFSEDLTFAREALELGMLLSFSGIVTFKSAHGVHEVARWAPEESLLVETDSPYLAPVPHRGKQCEPAMVVQTGEHLARLRGMAPEALADITTANARRLFGS